MEKLKSFFTNPDVVKSILAYMWSAATIAFMFMAVLVPIPSANEKILYLFIGFVTSGVIGVVIGFYFGSSQGSSEKTKMITDKMDSTISQDIKAQ